MIKPVVSVTLSLLLLSSSVFAFTYVPDSASSTYEQTAGHTRLGSSTDSTEAGLVVSGHGSGHQVVTAQYDDDDDGGGNNDDQKETPLEAQLSSATGANSSSSEECNLQQTQVNMCQYIRATVACTAEERYVPYLQTYYCTNHSSRWLLFIAYLIWMLVLFYALSEIAETFLVPAVEWISETLKLPPAVAGVTLLSFAGGAPDLFTQLAAVSSGGAVDLNLAVASTLGSGLFISCVMTASVVLIRTVDIVDRMAFVRDIVAYIAANLLVLVFVLDGKLELHEALLLILLYVAYVAIACYTSKKATAPEALGGVIQTSYGPNRAMQGLTKARLTAEQTPLGANALSASADRNSVRSTLARSWSWHNTGKLTQWLPLFLERLGLKGGAVELPVWQTGSAAGVVDDLETGEELLVIGGRNKQEVEEEHMALRASGSGPLMPSAAKSLTPPNPAPSPHPLPSKEHTLAQHHHTSPHDHSHQQQPAHIKAASPEHIVEMQQRHSQQAGSFWDSNDPQKALQMADGDHMDPHGLGHAFQSDAQHGLHNADEHMLQAAAFGNPLRQKSALSTEPGQDDYVDVIPALPHVIYSEGDEMALMKVTEVDGQVVYKLEDEGGADIVPIYAQEMGFTDQTWQQQLRQHAEATWHMYIHVDHKNKPKQALAIVTSPLVLFMHLTNPSLHIDSFTSLYGYCMSAAAPGFALVVLGLGPGALHWWGYFLLWAVCSSLVAVFVHWKLSMTGLGYASRMNASFAGISVVMSCMWLSLVASEVVALLETFGKIFNAPTDEIGGTILSWGETVPELVATFTLAKMGHSTMAIAGCFAGPVFNLMMGLGLPVLYQSIKQGALEMEVTNGIKLLVIQGVVILAVLVVMVPLVFNWRLHQQIGLGLLGVYALFQLFFVLVEEGVLWST